MQHEKNNFPKLIIMVLAVFTLKIFDTKVAVLIVIKKFHATLVQRNFKINMYFKIQLI